MSNISYQTTPWVITHPDLGVYVGRKGTQSFWTLLDTAGQPAVTTFPSLRRAQAHVETWDAAPDLQASVAFVPVASGCPFDLAACGLEVGDMFENLQAWMATDPSMRLYSCKTSRDR